MFTQQVSGRAKVSSRDSLLFVQGASSGNSGGLVKGWWWGVVLLETPGVLADYRECPSPSPSPQFYLLSCHPMPSLLKSLG